MTIYGMNRDECPSCGEPLPEGVEAYPKDDEPNFCGECQQRQDGITDITSNKDKWHHCYMFAKFVPPLPYCLVCDVEPCDKKNLPKKVHVLSAYREM